MIAGREKKLRWWVAIVDAIHNEHRVGTITTDQQSAVGMLEVKRNRPLRVWNQSLHNGNERAKTGSHFYRSEPWVRGERRRTQLPSPNVNWRPSRITG